MTHDEFFTAVKEGRIARAYLFQGEEEHIKESALQALRRRVLPEGLEAMNEATLQNPGAGEIIAAAETLPMLGERRLVIVRESALLTAGKAANEAEDSAKLAAYLERAPETACIVFYCRQMPDGRKKLTQALRQKATVVQFDPLGDAALHRWMGQQLRAQGKRIAPEGAAHLAFTAGRELLSLAQELAKLAAYLGEREEITRADIDAIVTPTLECTVFQMIDALVAGKQAEAFRLLGVMLDNRQERIGILAMMARQYRQLLHLQLMREGKVPDATAQQRLGVPPFAMRRLQTQLKGETAATLRDKLALCVDTDFAIKSGAMREGAALERAMLRLCGEAAS